MHCRSCGYYLRDGWWRTRRAACAECGSDNPYLLRLKKGLSRGLPEGQVQILDAYNPAPRAGRVAFAFESFDHPAVTALAERYDHARAMAGQQDEVRAQLALMDWLNRHLLAGARAIEVNDGVRWRRAFDPERKGDKFDRDLMDTDVLACSGFSFAFVKLASSVGHVARTVNVLAEDTPYGKHSVPHMIVEIWSNELVKWIVLDPLFNHSWWRKGRPLSALEVRDERFRNGGRDVETRWGLSETAFPRVPELGPTAGSPLKFAWVLYYTANNYAAFPVGQKFWRAMLFRDRHNEGRPLVGWPGGTHRPYGGEGLLDESPDRDDFDWPVNLTELNVTCDEPGVLSVHCQTRTPNSSHFEVRRGGRATRREEPGFKWRLRDGVNRLEVRAVNRLDVKGHPSRVELEWRPK